MGDIIRLLPDSVANQIAAGEVIQRPASVIKELVENAVDAGAGHIRIFIKDAGRTLIQVVDDGTGMSETDLRMAFERHATSKIRKANDLFTLHTMGFRGEALPSICAIAQVEVRSRRADDQLGSALCIEGSRVTRQENVVCDKGTNFMVRNLFFNVPVRRKFLKSDTVELANIMREFERLALVNPGVHLSIDTGTRTLDLRKGTFRQRINDIWRGQLDRQLLPVEIETSLVKISGYVSRPEFARRRNPLQYLFVNGRHMRHPYFHKAVVSCYDQLIASDTFPCYFLRFEVDPASIDVNISPTKNEIKFHREQEIWPIIVAAVKASLGKNGAVPSIDFESDAVEVEPLAAGEKVDRPELDVPDGYNPFEAYPGRGGVAPRNDAGTASSGDALPHQARRVSSASPKGWEELYRRFVGEARESAGERNRLRAGETPALPGLSAEAGSVTRGQIRPCLQVGLKYIVTTVDGGLIMVDQHRAHVKVLYERYIAQVRAGGIAAQRVMFPPEVTLSPAQCDALAVVGDDLRRAGFELEYIGDDRWSLNAVPAMLGHTDACDAVMRILESVDEDSASYGTDSAGGAATSMISRMALLLARASAVTRGDSLSPEEMEALVAELLALPDPGFTPSGKRIFTMLDPEQIGHMLG